jgi:hypothetical protein
MAVRKNSAQRPLRQRIIALAAAYAIALSGLAASFGAARAAAEVPASPGGIICHTGAAEQPSHSTDDTNGKICADCCGTGYLMLMAALPPPPAIAIAALVSSRHDLVPLARFVLARGAEGKSHRSRAPPLTA